jgi:SAM-dependent methyltransferase
MTTNAEWPVAFFDDDYLRIYRPTMTPERTSAEADFIAGALAPPAGARVLDLGCGFGRHAIAMAGRGYEMTGVDFNPRYLEIAGQEAAAAGVRVRWRTGDMRALEFDGEFDAAYSYFSSFGYYGDDENEQVLAGIARALKPGGRFLLDMVNRDRILVDPNLRTWAQRDDGALFVEEVSIDLRASRLVSRQRLIDPRGGPQVTKEYSLRVYTCAELTALLRRQGLRVVDAWGGPAREPYAADSRRLILLSERAA